jgi:hypothetical protein
MGLVAAVAIMAVVAGVGHHRRHDILRFVGVGVGAFEVKYDIKTHLR